MSVSTAGPRHRATGRASTPLTPFTRTITGQIDVVARRSTAAVAAGSTMAVGIIGAVPALADGSLSASVDTSAANIAHASVPTSPVVAAPDDATWNGSDEFTIGAEKPAAAPRTAAATAARTTTTTPKAAPAQRVLSGGVLSIAAQLAGIRYVYGGATQAGFDCSGYVMYVFAQVGISLPHSSTKMRDTLTHISRADAQPGDIVFMYNSSGGGHVGIYAGGNQMYDSPGYGQTTGLHNIWSSSPIFLRP